MPRDLNGNMTLVTGNPVVTRTAISSAVQNATIADLAAEIQDSLSRSGKGGMNAPFYLADGDEALPGFAFNSDHSTGWWKAVVATVHELTASVSGTWRLAIRALGVYINGILNVTGNATLGGNVTLSSASGSTVDATGGILTLNAPGANSVRIQTNTTNRAVFSTTGVDFNGGVLSNLGTPTNNADATTVGYVNAPVPTTAPLVSQHANVSSTIPEVEFVHGGMARFTSRAGTNYMTITGAIAGANSAGTGGDVLMTFGASSGAPLASAAFTAKVPVAWYDSSAVTLSSGYLIVNSSREVTFFSAGLSLANGDIIYLLSCPPWIYS